MAIIEMDRREFDEYAFKHPYRSFYQTTQYGTLMSKHGYKPIYLGLDEGGEIRAAALILVKNQFGIKLGYSPRGFLIDFNDYQLVEDFTNHLKNYLSKQNIANFTIFLNQTFIIKKVHCILNKSDSVIRFRTRFCVKWFNQ